MADDLILVKGEWHQDYMGRLRQVIVYDEEDDALEVQRGEGAIADCELDSRNRLETESSEAPKDGSGRYYDRVACDMDNAESPMHLTDRYGPKDEGERED